MSDKGNPEEIAALAAAMIEASREPDPPMRRAFLEQDRAALSAFTRCLAATTNPLGTLVAERLDWAEFDRWLVELTAALRARHLAKYHAIREAERSPTPIAMRTR